jgi:hypothetical protein
MSTHYIKDNAEPIQQSCTYIYDLKTKHINSRILTLLQMRDIKSYLFLPCNVITLLYGHKFSLQEQLSNLQFRCLHT